MAKSNFDPFGTSIQPDSEAFALANRQSHLSEAEKEADDEQREIVVRTRKVQLSALRGMPSVVGLCMEAIEDPRKEHGFKDRLAACRVLMEAAGVSRVPVPNVYVDNRSVTVNAQDADFLRRLGMYDGPDPTMPAGRSMEHGEPTIIDMEVEEDDGMPDWSR